MIGQSHPRVFARGVLGVGIALSGAAVAGCASTSHAGQTATVHPASFAACLTRTSDGAARVATARASSTWARTTRPGSIMRVTFIALRAGSIYSSAELTSPRAYAAFYATTSAAARAAGVARADAHNETIKQQLNAVIASVVRPSLVQRSLVNGCLDHALKIVSTRRKT